MLYVPLLNTVNGIFQSIEKFYFYLKLSTKLFVSLIKNVLLLGKSDQAGGPETFFKICLALDHQIKFCQWISLNKSSSHSRI